MQYVCTDAGQNTHVRGQAGYEHINSFQMVRAHYALDKINMEVSRETQLKNASWAALKLDHFGSMYMYQGNVKTKNQPKNKLWGIWSADLVNV